MPRISIPPKSPADTVLVNFDFTSTLPTGDSVVLAATTVEVWSGVDANPGAIIGATSVANAPIVGQTLTGGVLGVIYVVTVKATTAAGNIISLEAYLAIIRPAL